MNKPHLIIYKGPEFVAFKHAPGWYVYQWRLLGTVAGVIAHGYEIIAGPFETETQAQQAIS